MTLRAQARHRLARELRRLAGTLTRWAEDTDAEGRAPDPSPDTDPGPRALAGDGPGAGARAAGGRGHGLLARPWPPGVAPGPRPGRPARRAGARPRSADPVGPAAKADLARPAAKADRTTVEPADPTGPAARTGRAGWPGGLGHGSAGGPGGSGMATPAGPGTAARVAPMGSGTATAGRAASGTCCRATRARRPASTVLRDPRPSPRPRGPTSPVAGPVTAGSPRAGWRRVPDRRPAVRRRGRRPAPPLPRRSWRRRSPATPWPEVPTPSGRHATAGLVRRRRRARPRPADRVPGGQRPRLAGGPCVVGRPRPRDRRAGPPADAIAGRHDSARPGARTPGGRTAADRLPCGSGHPRTMARAGRRPRAGARRPRAGHRPVAGPPRRRRAAGLGARPRPP